MPYLIVNKKNMFIKFEFIAGLVEKGEVVFEYDEKKPRIPKKDDLEEFDFGNKANPLREKRQYKTKSGFKDKEYAPRRSETYTPAYKKSKFNAKSGGSFVASANKKGNSGLGYKKKSK